MLVVVERKRPAAWEQVRESERCGGVEEEEGDAVETDAARSEEWQGLTREGTSAPPAEVNR